MANATITNGELIVKMHINLKLKFLDYFFIALLIFIVVMFGAIGFGGWTILRGSSLLTHTREVENKLNSVRREYDEALYLGQRKMLGANYNGEISESRHRTIQAVDAVINTVSDNPAQIENAERLKTSIEQRFIIQDEQFATMKRSETGEIIYDEKIVFKSVETNAAIGSVFARMRETESNLFFKRYESLSLWQWRLTTVAGLAMAFLLLTVGVFFYLYRKQLKRTAIIGSQMSHLAQEVSQSGSESNLQAELQKFADMFLNDRPPPENYAQ